MLATKLLQACCNFVTTYSQTCHNFVTINALPQCWNNYATTLYFYMGNQHLDFTYVQVLTGDFQYEPT